MVQPPTTVQQLIFLVLLVLPGLVYQFLRERWRGPVPGEQNLSERVLRAMTASIALDSIYAIAVGPRLAEPRPWTGRLGVGSGRRTLERLASGHSCCSS